MQNLENESVLSLQYDENVFTYDSIIILFMLLSDRQPECKRKRTLIRPLLNVQKNFHNIFSSPYNNPEDFSPSQLHHIVGEDQWKRTAYGHFMPRLQTISVSESKDELKALKTIIQEQSNDPPSIQKSMNNTRGSRFCLDQIDKDTRQQRILEKHSQTQTIWRKEEASLLQRTNNNRSISFNAVKNLYLHANPDKMHLINDNLPQYWQHSLRDNSKTLYRHLRNNPFKKEVAEEMLQTLAGRKKLEQSMPKLKTVQHKLSLNGKRTRLQSTVSTGGRVRIQEAYLADYAYKEKWLSEISYTQTKTSRFGTTKK